MWFHVVCGMRCYCHEECAPCKSVDLKSVQLNVTKSVTKIMKDGGSIELTKLIDSVYTKSVIDKIVNACKTGQQDCFDLPVAFKTCH